MRIAQINNQQTNFEGGVVGKKGAVKFITDAYPDLARRVEQGLIDGNKPTYDFFVFSPTESHMQAMVSDKLNAAKMLVMSIGDSSEPTTIQSLINIMTKK